MRPSNGPAASLFRNGRQIFRFDTFGDERFWSGALKLHQAIAGARLAVSVLVSARQLRSLPA